MKRLVLMVAIAGAFVVPVGSAHAAGAFNGRMIGAYFSQGPNTLSVWGSVYEDVTGNVPPNTYANAYMSTPNGYNYGSGSLTVSLDPTGTVGRLTGTIPGNNGPITVDVSFTGLSVNSGYLPTVFFDANPGPPSFTAIYSWSRSGHATATVSSSVGTVATNNANANSNYGLYIQAP